MSTTVDEQVRELAQAASNAWQAQMQLGYLRHRQKPRRCTCKKDTPRRSYRCAYCGPFHRMQEDAEERIAEICAERWDATGFELERTADEMCERTDAQMEQWRREDAERAAEAILSVRRSGCEPDVG